MKKFFYALFLLCLPLMAQAEFVSEADAEAIASQFLNANVAAKPGRQNAPSQVRMRKAADVLPQQHFYIFNSEDGNGFVIVSANDIARPILGYSDAGTIDVNNLPSNLQWWLGEYNAQIEAGIANHIPATEDIQKEWKAFKQGKAQSATAVVGPLLTTQWDQGTPYNDMCPIYTGTTRAFSGCVATATAQIMNYHEYPTLGIGSKTYTTNTHHFTLSADFANTTYDWRNMKDSYKDLSSCSQAQKEAVATLMYHVGVASEMNYAADADGESGSDNRIAAYGLLHNFGYASDMMYISRELYNSDMSYMLIIQMQLDKELPILFQGTNEAGDSGHSFVCDGYNSDYYFHFNWGWSGDCDGYYPISALQPGSGGSGSGEGNYNYNQGIVVNIHPDNDDQSYNLQLYSDILVINDSITPGNMISREAMIMNVGKEAFTGNIYFVAINQNEPTKVYWLDSLVNQTLTTCNVIDYFVESNPTHIAGAVANTFQTGNTYDMEEGDYYLTFIFKDTQADTLGHIGSDYALNATPLHINPSPYLHSGKYFVIAEGTDAYWFMSSDLTSTSTKRLVADTLAQKDELYWIHNDPKFVWNVTRMDELNYTIESNGKYLSWTSGNSATMSTTPKEFGIYPLGDEEGTYAVQLDIPNAEPRILSYNTANGSHYFAFYQNTNQQYALRFVEVVEFDSVTIRAKVPSSWGENISCWVWYDGYSGEWKTPTKNGDWYEYSGIAGFNIIFVNGTTWSGDNNQTVDIMAVSEDVCIQLGANASGKRNYIQVDCPEPEPTPEPEPEPTENDYLILAKRNSGNYYYLTPDKVSGKDRLIAVDAGAAERSMLDSANAPLDYVWSVEETETGYLLKSATNQYIACNAAKTVTLAAEGTELQKRDNSDGTATFYYAASETETRYLSLAQNTYDYFVFYANENQFTHLLLVKRESPATAVEQARNEPVAPQKLLRNGQVIIVRGGVEYNLMGQPL